jgi:phosphoribosylamine--glycine ligase
VRRCVVIGSGAREHALAWALAKSAEVVVTPGNAGIAAHGIACVTTPATQLEADLFVIGPDQQVVDGLADDLRTQGKTVFGPGADGAQLEGSKAFMKEFLASAGIPTAEFGVFDNEEDALTYLDTMAAPYVIKTDGLAAGKGVLVTHDIDAAKADVREKLSGQSFAGAGRTIVIEEGLNGPECSLMVLCDGRNVTSLASSQDFKRVGDGDVGLNTGGMGAFAPFPMMTPELLADVMENVVAPTVRELARRDIDYRGVLYAGVMLTSKGPKLLEYNARFGDPETQVLVPLYGDEFFDLLLRVANGDLAGAAPEAKGAAVTVVLAANGYPGAPRAGDVITGLGADGQLAEPVEGVTIFHAGSARNDEGQFVTSGGRVVAITGVGDTLEQARSRAYLGASLVTFEGRVMRSDIALSTAGGAT